MASCLGGRAGHKLGHRAADQFRRQLRLMVRRREHHHPAERLARRQRALFVGQILEPVPHDEVAQAVGDEIDFA